MSQKAFEAIKLFITDLTDVFTPKKKSDPLNLYKRLVNYIKVEDENAVGKVISGFDGFFQQYGSFVL